MKDDLIYFFFPQLLQLFSLLYFVLWTSRIFAIPLPFGEVYFLKSVKAFQFLISFGSAALFSEVQKPFTSFRSLALGHKGLATFYITWGPPHWAVLSPCSSLLWLLSSLAFSRYPAGNSWLSSHCNSLFNCMLSSYNLCSILFTQKQELNLTRHWRHTTKCPLKIPWVLWQHFK